MISVNLLKLLVAPANGPPAPPARHRILDFNLNAAPSATNLPHPW
jgi:hypothetical protein